MAELVAIAAAGGDRFTAALLDAWDAGDAVLPLDPRLPRPAAERLLDGLAPTVVVGEDGRRRPRPGGRPVDPGDALVMATSGSTGEPKGVVLTHDAVRASALAGSELLGVDPDTDRWLACLPLSHMGGLGVITRALTTGTPLEVHATFAPTAVLEAAGRGCTLTTLVPTALRRVDALAFRRVIVGGADLPPDLPPNVVTSYGLTETCGGFAYDGVPFPGCEVRIDRGEILVRGPVLLRCYRDGGDPRRDGWLPTGDAGHLDGDGRLHVDGRISDLIITGGENVWPGPVEDAVRRHPDIAEVGVAGRPDPEWGERVVAFVEVAPGGRPPPLEELRAVVKEELPAFCAPREVVVVDRLPRTASGKVRRASLR